MKKISLCAVLIIMANFAYANDLTKTENYYPDGKYGIGSRFARKNPTIEKVKNNVRLTVHSYDNGPIHMDIHKYGGGIYFERRFEDHPLSEHGGWSRPPVTQQVNDFHGSIENGKLGVTNAKIYGVEMHPNDAYDAKDGGDHPYDIYTFTVDGESRYTSIREVEKPKPLPTPPNSPNQPNKNGDNGDKGNQSEPNDSRNDKIRQDSADNSPDLANNNSGEVPLPQSENYPPCVDCCINCGKDPSKYGYGGEFQQVDYTSIDNQMRKAVLNGDITAINNLEAASQIDAATANHLRNLAQLRNEVPTKLIGKNGKIDMSKFTKPASKNNAKSDWVDPKTGWRISPDRAGANSHRSDYKLIDKKGKRIATLSKDGRVLRK